MLRILKKKEAQVIMGEYVLVLFLVAAVLVSMMMYFRRAVQARIHESRDYMVSQVRVRTTGMFNGNLYKEYEPYYGNTSAVVSRGAEDETRLSSGASSGIFDKIFNEITTVVVNSETAPPRDFNLTTPIN